MTWGARRKGRGSRSQLFDLGSGLVLESRKPERGRRQSGIVEQSGVRLPTAELVSRGILTYELFEDGREVPRPLRGERLLKAKGGL